MDIRYMLDTDICIYISRYWPPEARTRFVRVRPTQVVMSVVTYGELYCGASKSNQRAQALTELGTTVRGIPVEDLTATISEAYGIIRAAFENQG